MKKILFICSFILLTFSCNEKTNNQPIIENAVDNAESFPINSLKKGRYSENLVDQIYSQLMKNDEKLKQLDEKFIKSNEKAEKTVIRYEEILNNQIPILGTPIIKLSL